jgi:hypothetical protein
MATSLSVGKLCLIYEQSHIKSGQQKKIRNKNQTQRYKTSTALVG